MTIAVVFVVPWDACQQRTLWQRWTGMGNVSLPPAMATQRVEPTPLPTVPADASIGLGANGNVLEELYSRANPSVVQIKGLSPAGARGGELLQDFLDSLVQREYFVLREGSGFIYDHEGHIVTNYHVVEGTDELQVTFFDGATFSATIVGMDALSDLAVLHVNCPADRLRTLPLGDSDAVRVGQPVVAIGNPFGLQGSMSAGIVSAVGRFLPASTEETGATTYAVPGVLQTDAAINPGNSGGPLLNLAGQVIGVNTAIQSPVEGSAGVGFAVPSRIVARVAQQLIDTGHYAHPWIGVSTVTLNRMFNRSLGLPADLRGALVDVLVEDGPAALAGLQACTERVNVAGEILPRGGDVLLSIDDQPIFTHEDLLNYLALRTEVGQAVRLTVLRGDEVMEVEVIVEAQPDPLTLQPTLIPVE
jgi:S1-C subfamily serine protease